MDIKKTTNQRIGFVPLADMETESGYQRATNAAQVTNIASDFNEAKLGVLVVSERNGKFHIMDGQHRCKALRKLGYTHAPCIVLTGLTFEQEAEYFRSQNIGNRSIRPMEFFKAGLIAGDEQCATINRIVRSNGFHIDADSGDFCKICAIKTLFTITEDYGYKTLDDTLCLIANTWSGVAKASQALSLLGVAEFVSRYGIAEFAERLKDKFTAVLYDYEDMSYIWTSPDMTARKRFCRAIVTHYNKGLNVSSGKRLKWEG